MDNLETRYAQMCIQDWGNSKNTFTVQSEMFNDLKKKKKSTTFRRKFEAAPDDTARVALCLAESSYKRLSDEMDRLGSLPGTTGFGTHAAGHRQAGNEHYRAKEYLKALGKYTLAILTAPAVVSPKYRGDQTLLEELPLGYSNRSVVYFALKQYQFALDDIETAFACGYARYKPSFAILTRKCECLARLGRASEAKIVLEELRADPNATTDCLKKLEKLINSKKSKAQPEEFSATASTSSIDQFGSRFSAQDKYSQLSQKVAIEAHEGSPNGRRLVAIEKIQFGEILALTSPYASVLAHKFEGQFCHHCCREMFADPKNILRPLDCPECSSVLFCNEQCRSKACNSYHRFECGNGFILVPSTSTDCLALRLLCMHTPKEILEVQKTERILADPVDYSHINQLMTGTGATETYEDLLEKTITACIYVHLLKQKGYFASAPEQCTESWVGALLLRLMRQVACNSRMIEAWEATSNRPLLDPGESHHIQICPTFALLNHSCAPNVSLEKIPNQRDSAAILATRSIVPGEEVTITVNDITADNLLSLKIRLEKIKEKSGFECTCARCHLEQKNTPDGAKFYYALACTACRGLIQKDADSESYQCTSCHLDMSHDEYARRNAQANQLDDKSSNELYSIAMLGQNINLHWSFAALKTIYQQAKTLLHPTSYQLGSFIRQLAGFYLMIGQLQTAADYAEEHLQLVGTGYGEESLKMMVELENYGREMKEMADSLEGYKAKMTLVEKGQHDEAESRFQAMAEREVKLKQMYEL